MNKKKAGFTLVELIVVIAILGILAAVAIPAYNGYIKKAHEAADIAQLDAIKTAAIAACAEEGAVTGITLTISSGTITAVSVKGDQTAGEDVILTESGTAIFGTGATSKGSIAADFKLYLGLGSSATTIGNKLDGDGTYKSGAVWRAAAEGDKAAGWSDS